MTSSPSPASRRVASEMVFVIKTLLPTFGILLGMALCVGLGRHIARRAVARGEEAGAGAIDGAIFALFGLMIAFTFAGASGRFDARRAQIVTEANAIGTAYLRLDLLPADAQGPLRALFRDYLASRISLFQNLGDEQAAAAEHERGMALQGQIWSRAVAAARGSGDAGVLILVVSSLNEMIDITATRRAARQTHVPAVILVVLFVLAFASALVVGYATAQNRGRTWFRALLFAVAIGSSIYLILDLEYPRFGLIRIEQTDHVMIELLQQMQ